MAAGGFLREDVDSGANEPLGFGCTLGLSLEKPLAVNSIRRVSERFSRPEPGEPAALGLISSWLTSCPTWAFALYAIGASFSTYFCMYAFRKPFLAAEYQGISFFGTQIEFKTALVISQIIGYTISKYIGIKVCSEATAATRTRWLISLVLAAEAALVLFAVVPAPWQFLALFLNGLPLGMVMGLVIAYLEGRRTSDILLAGVSCSYILSSAIVKDAGRMLMSLLQVTEYWMPAVTGVCFLPLFLFSVWALSQLPPPDAADVAARVERRPMNAADRNRFVGEYLFGLVLLLIGYVLLTAFRDFRDNYGVELLKQLGFDSPPGIFVRTELPAMFGVLAVLATLNFIKSNRWGLMAAFGLMIIGALLIGAATLLLDAQIIDGFWWMILIGLGAYMAYVPYTSVLFDRLIASVGVAGTAVFAIYLADAIGYTGSIGLQLYKDVVHPSATRLAFFHSYCYFISLLCAVLLAASSIYFARRNVRQRRLDMPGGAITRA